MRNIESLIKPRDAAAVRNVTVFGVTYQFKQLIPGRWIALNVADRAAAALIGTKSYREFTDQLTSTLAAPAPVAIPPASSVATITGSVPDPGVLPPEAVPTGTAAAAAEKSEADSEVAAGGGSGAAAEPPAAVADVSADAGVPAPADAAAADTGAGAADAEIADAAKLLLSGAPANVKRAAADASLDVLQAALAIEEGERRPRASVVSSLKEAVQAKAEPAA